LIDGENLDATLGSSILGGRPNPDQRPRWERVLAFAQQVWTQPVKGLFFLNASSGSLPMPFVQALLAIGFTPVPLSGEPHQKVVDMGISAMLDAIAEHGGDVLLASHDGDFAPGISAVVEKGRQVGLLAFREFTSSSLTALGVQVFDLEYDVDAFNVRLPRLRIIPVDEFNAADYL
jgi:uncharacterized protein